MTSPFTMPDRTAPQGSECRIPKGAIALPPEELPLGATAILAVLALNSLELSPCDRQVILDACLFFNTQRYDLFALVVMPY